MPISRARQRLVVNRLLTAITRASARVYYPDLPLPEGRDMMLIGAGIAIGHMSGKPVTLAALARWTEMPAPTLKRKLATLTARGYVVRQNHHYYLNEDRVNSDDFEKLLTANIERIVNAAKTLSKME